MADHVQSNNDYSQFNIVRKLLNTIQYQTLDMTNIHHQEDIIIHLKETHKSLLDDYISVLTNDHICKSLKSQLNTPFCEFKNCQHALRLYRNKTADIETFVNDAECSFFQDIMDSFHCYLYHLYDTGLRTNITFDDGTNSDNDEKDEEKHLDVLFSKVVQHIKEKKSELQKLDGFDFSRYDHNKFSLSNSSTCNIHSTFMDGFMRYIIDRSVSNKQILSILKILSDAEYDSESVEQDILQGDKKQSNIGAFFPHNDNYNIMKQFIRHCKLSERSFQIGYRFYYWKYYEALDEKDQYVQQYHNINDHSGYSPPQLYISRKYKSIKPEILHNNIYSLNVVQLNQAIMKAKKYIDTSKAKQITALHGNKKGVDRLHFNLPKGTKLTAKNILSIVLYTDWTNLCTEFSKTFRPMKPYHTLQMVKNRNREFANWSRILRETVEYFGNLGDDDRLSETKRKKHRFEKGPFFCGLNFIMVIPLFNLRLCSPTSTTKQIEVATRFADDEGIIIQMNNNGNANSCMLRGWNCTWLSIHPGEDEILWMGGRYPIKLETIKIKTTEQLENYSEYFKTLFYFECMILGVNMKKEDNEDSQLTKKDYKLLSNLINQNLGTNNNNYPNYINNTFEAFVYNKKQIVINLLYVELYFGAIKDLLFYPISKYIRNEKTGKNSMTNLFKPILFKLFSNVESIIMNTTSWNFDGRQCEYALDIASLLLLMKNAQNNITITLRAMHRYKVKTNKYNRMVMNESSYDGVSWLSEMKCNHVSGIYSISGITTKVMNYGKHDIQEDFVTIQKSRSQ
eukprot:167418_1